MPKKMGKAARMALLLNGTKHSGREDGGGREGHEYRNAERAHPEHGEGYARDGMMHRYGRGEPIRFGGAVAMSGDPGGRPLTREKAESWVEGLKSADPAKPRGGKWTMDQIKPIAQKYGVPTEGGKFAEFWAVMNALYCDYYAVAKKHNALNPDFFADMAMAFINDEDAVKNKAAVYYECIVEH